MMAFTTGNCYKLGILKIDGLTLGTNVVSSICILTCNQAKFSVLSLNFTRCLYVVAEKFSPIKSVKNWPDHRLMELKVRGVVFREIRVAQDWERILHVCSCYLQ